MTGVALNAKVVDRQPNISFAVFTNEAIWQQLLEGWDWIVEEIRAA